MGGAGCRPLSLEGRGTQGWFWASDHHQFWPLPLGTPNLSWQRVARQRALLLLSLLWTASAPQEWPSFLVVLLGGKKNSVKLWHLPWAPAASPSYARWVQGRNPLLCQGRNNCVQVPEFKEEERRDGMEWNGMGWEQYQQGAGLGGRNDRLGQGPWGEMWLGQVELL